MIAKLPKRILGAALLDEDCFEEVEADRSASWQALLVVLLAALSAGFGSVPNNGYPDLLVIAAAALVGWWLWAAVTLFVGTKILPGPHTVSDMGELLRTLGFAASPGLPLFLAAVPGIDWLVFQGCGLWMLASMVVGVRQALDYEGPRRTWRALAVCAIGFPIYVLLLATALVVFGPWPI